MWGSVVSYWKETGSLIERLFPSDSDDVDEDAPSSPIATMMYEFLTQPESSRPAFWWSLLTSLLVMIRILEIGVESVNGPNQYRNRSVNRARYNFLFTDEHYFDIYIACFVPLILDAFSRVVLLILLVFEEENAPLYKKFRKNFSEQVLFVGDVVGVIPFFVYAGYIRPQRMNPSQSGRIIMRIVELFTTGRIYRVIRRFPAIRAISTALSNSFRDLILPMFFFFVFNITAGVFFYFAEPCYNTTLCPWQDVFDSTFYSIVTMTTTGYGNQVPMYEMSRFVACCVMIFGALYLSLPLAIIGNEYDKAWTAIQEELALSASQPPADEISPESSPIEASPSSITAMSREKKNSFIKFTKDGVHVSRLPSISEERVHEGKAEENNLQPGKNLEWTDRRNSVSQYSPIILFDKIQRTSQCLRGQSVTANVDIAHLLSDIISLLPAFELSIEEILRAMYMISLKDNESKQQADKGPRRFSIVGGGAGISWQPHAGQSVISVKQFTFSNPFADNELNIRKSSTQSSTKLSMSNSNNNYVSVARHDDTADSLESFSLSDDTTSDVDSDGDSERNEKELVSVVDRPPRKALPINLQTPPPVLALNMEISPDSDNSEDESEDDSDERVSSDDDKQEDVRAPVVAISASAISSHEVKESSGATMEESVFIPPRRHGRMSLYQQALGMLGVRDKESRRRTVSEEFLRRVQKVSENPDSLRSRIWVVLELPQSSKEARVVQLVIVLFVIVSIFVLYTQSVNQLTLYGESTPICGALLKAYCSDKSSALLDPGCYVQDIHGPTANRLLYHCNGPSCFGHGLNFGSDHTNMSCLNDIVSPFQSKTELDYTYGSPYLFTSRQQMHRINPICTRIECRDNYQTYYDGNPMWIAVEFVINIIFSVELLLRITVAESLYAYWQDKMNLFDICAVLPFYTTLIGSRGHGINFSILASSPDPIVFVMLRSLKVFRLFKLTRQFRASKVLAQTALKIWKQVLGMVALLCFMVTIFSIILYEMERGKQCFVGDRDCDVPLSIKDTVHVGDVVYINKLGLASQFPNMFFGVWFSFVTLTTTGYGDIVPVTNAGQVMAIFLMLAGSFYMAMPLTAAASTFYTEHEREKDRHVEVSVSPDPIAGSTELAAVKVVTPSSSTVLKARFDQRLLLTIRYSLSQIKRHSGTLRGCLDDVYLLIAHSASRWNDVSEIATNNRLASRVSSCLLELEEDLQSADRDVVTLLELYHDVLQAKK